MDMDSAWSTRDEKLQVVDYWWHEQRGLCCLCGELMRPYRRQHTNDPAAATIEHLIPRRENGPNTAGNVRLAHAACNHALGALWEINKKLAAQGKPQASHKWAINNARQRAREAMGLPPLELAKVKGAITKAKKKKVGVDWCAANVVSLPRGATLMPEHQNALGIIVRQRIPKPKMTARETAQWLKQKGVRGA